MDIAVLYGSETGTARELAYGVTSWLLRRRISTRPCSLDDATLDSIELAIIICSTAGDGEAPRTMRKCWSKLLSKACPRLSLKYALYGLGDARYGVKFNAAARRLDARLTQLGATRVFDRVLADACVLGGVVAPLPEFLARLGKHLGVDGSYDAAPSSGDDLPACRYTVLMEEEDDVEELRRYETEALQWDTPDAQCHLDAVCEAKTRLTSDDWRQDVRNLVLTSSFEYASGDVAAVLPRNETAVVQRFLALAKRTAAPDIISLQEQDESHLLPPRPRLPRKVKLAMLAERCLDLTGPPSRETVGRLAVFAADPEEAAKLRELASPAGAALFDEYVVQERRSLMEVLDDFSSVSLTLDRFLDAFEWLRPRSFSIASAPANQQDGAIAATLKSSRLELCVAKVQIETSLGRKKLGVCSSYLCDRVDPGDVLAVATYRGSFFAKEKIASPSPLLLVGPGTGVAPMRAILQRCVPGEKRNLLFFGCRDPAHDFLYGPEWSRLADVVDVVVAPSRPPRIQDRAYVTNKLRERKADVLRTIDDGGAIFIAGNVRMATDVRHVVVDVLKTTGLSDKHANATLAKLERDGRFVVEAYG